MTDANRCHRCTVTPAPHLAVWQGGWLTISPGVPLAFCDPCWREAINGSGEVGSLKGEVDKCET